MLSDLDTECDELAPVQRPETTGSDAALELSGSGTWFGFGDVFPDETYCGSL